MAWTLARSLEHLRAQLSQFAPNRSKVSDGSIGDAAHQERESDHNPDANGVVRAIDITNDPNGGFSAQAFAEALRASRDPRIKYVIWNRRMFSSYSNSKRRAWEWGSAKGHTHHIHVSIGSDGAAASDTGDWALPGSSPGRRPTNEPDYRGGEYGLQPFDVRKPALRKSGSNPDDKVKYLQGVLKVEAGQTLDLGGSGYGTFGPQTEQAVKNLQAFFGLPVTAVVDWDGPDGNSPGPNSTWRLVDALALGPEAAKPATAETPAPVAETTAATPAPAEDEVAGDSDRPIVPRPGAINAAAAAQRAGFRGDDLVTITMIAGRESRWDAAIVNEKTSDRGMWQINWKTVQGDGFTEVRERLGLREDTDLLDLDTNAEIAFFMYDDARRRGDDWSPWRGSDTGQGGGPGWDPDGSHLWRTEEFAEEARAAVQALEI